MLSLGGVAVVSVAILWMAWRVWSTDPMPVSTNQRMKDAGVHPDNRTTRHNPIDKEAGTY